MLRLPRSFRDKFHELAFRAFLRSGPRTGGGKRYWFRAHSGKRERQRRVLQNAHLNQIHSHKPGTLQPHHIFGGSR